MDKMNLSAEEKELIK
jgi:serine/threonine kinase 38